MKKNTPKLPGRGNPAAKKNSLSSSRCSKFLFLAAAAGASAGIIRHIVDFFPVLQGMAAGSAAGGTAGFFLKKSAPPPKERAWLWLNITLTYILSLGAVLGFLNRRHFSPPLSWLKDVATGAETEYFFGAPVFSWGLYGGALSGAGWVFFNILDSIFFFFTGLIILGVSAGARKNSAARDGALGAKRFFILQWGAIILIFSSVAISGGIRSRLIHDSAGARSAAREALSAFEGRYVFEDGRNLLEASGRGGAFTVEASGHDSLLLKAEPEGGYYMPISAGGRHFTGRLYRGKSLERVFLKFPGGGRVLISARRRSPGGGKYDLVLEARRE